LPTVVHAAIRETRIRLVRADAEFDSEKKSRAFPQETAGTKRDFSQAGKEKLTG